MRSAGRPHCGAAINSPRRGARRGAADGRAARLRLLPPPPAAARAHTRGWREGPRGAATGGCQLHRPGGNIPLGSLPDLLGVMVPGDKFASCPTPHILIPKCPYHRSLQRRGCLSSSKPAKAPSASPSRKDLARFVRDHRAIRSWSPRL